MKQHKILSLSIEFKIKNFGMNKQINMILRTETHQIKTDKEFSTLLDEIKTNMIYKTTKEIMIDGGGFIESHTIKSINYEVM